MLTMEEAMKQSQMRFAAGEIVKGKIIEVRPKEVLVDIGYKSEGAVPLAEFMRSAELVIHDALPVMGSLDAEFARIQLPGVMSLASSVADTLRLAQAIQAMNRKAWSVLDGSVLTCVQKPLA